MFDVLTVAAVADELHQTVLDGRIQKLGMVNTTTIAAEIYADRRRRGFVASADAESARLMLTDAMPSVDPNLITPFGLLLRKYVRGGFLVGIEQPSLERLVRLSIVKRLTPHNERDPAVAAEEPVGSEDDDEDDSPWAADLTRVELYVEIMGRHSNLILVDADGRVMDSAKRVTTSMSRVRPIWPKTVYSLPPVQDKPDPRRLTSASVETLVHGAKPSAKLAEVLVRSLRGVSPQIGREIAFRTLGVAHARVDGLTVDHHGDLARDVRSMFEPIVTSSWSPRVYENDEGGVAYSAIPLGYLAAECDERAVDSISAAIAACGVDGPSSPGQDHAQRRARILAAIEREWTKVTTRERSLREQHARSANVDQLRTWGELIYAYLWQIQPGDRELVVDDVRVPLDPDLSAKDNALRYFEDYRKSQKAGESLPERIAQAETERDYLDQLAIQVRQADGFAAIEALRLEFEDHTGGRQPVGERGSRPSRKTSQRRVSALTEASGNAIYIGRSGRENDQVTFDIAGPEDTWLHARGVPGSHVIVRWLRPAEDEDGEAVDAAAALAAWYSGSRASGTVEVDVTRRKHVRKIKGGGPGMVTYRNERTIAVAPRDEAALQREGRLN